MAAYRDYLNDQARTALQDGEIVSAIDILRQEIRTDIDGRITAINEAITALEASFGGRALGPTPNTFLGATRALAEAARNTQGVNDPTWLAMYDADDELNIELQFEDLFYVYQRRVASAWVDNGEVLVRATALTLLNTTVTMLGDMIAALSSALTSLTATVNGKADASALTALMASVTTLGDMITALSSALTSLTATVDGKADASALTALMASVTTLGDMITALSSALTSLTATVNGKADASALTALTVTVTTLGDMVTALSSAITALIATVDGKADAAALTALTASVTTLGDMVTALSSALTALIATVDGKADASALTALMSSVTVLDESITAISTSVTELTANLEATDEAAGLEVSAREALEVRVVQNEEGVMALARWTVKLTVGELTGGIGLVNDGGTVKLIIAANRVAIIPPGVTDLTNARIPFIVDEGIVYLDLAVIREATIGTALIEDAFLTNFTARFGTIMQAFIEKGNIFELTLGNFIQSDNYVEDTTGIKISRDGTGEFNSLVKTPYLQANVLNASTVYTTTGGGVTVINETTIHAVPMLESINDFDYLESTVELSGTGIVDTHVPWSIPVHRLVDGFQAGTPSDANRMGNSIGGGDARFSCRIWKSADGMTLYLRRSAGVPTNGRIRTITAIRGPSSTVATPTTTVDSVYRRGTSTPATPTGGTNVENHTPTGTSRTELTATATQNVYISTRLRTYVGGVFQSATAWGPFDLLHERTGTDAQLDVDVSSLTILEGGTDTVRVRLTAQPSGDVVVTATEASSKISVFPGSVTYSTVNWNTYQFFAVMGIEDVDSLDETATLVLTATGAISDVHNVAVTVTDDEVPMLEVEDSSIEVDEGGTETIRVRLTSQPPGTVEVRSASSNSEVTVTPNQRDFNAGDWSAYKVFFVTAAQDTDMVDDTAIVTLTATGALFDTASVLVTVTDDDVNLPPTANAGNNVAAEVGDPVSITGSGTDPDGTISSYLWTRISGPIVSLTGANTTTVSFTAPSSPGTIVLQLRVTDNDGATDTDTVSISVTQTPVLPDAPLNLEYFFISVNSATWTWEAPGSFGTGTFLRYEQFIRIFNSDLTIAYDSGWVSRSSNLIGSITASNIPEYQGGRIVSVRIRVVTTVGNGPIIRLDENIPT